MLMSNINTIIYIALGAIVLVIVALIVLLVVLLAKNSKSKKAPEPGYMPQANMPGPGYGNYAGNQLDQRLRNELKPDPWAGNQMAANAGDNKTVYLFDQNNQPAAKKTGAHLFALIDAANPTRRFECRIDSVMTVGRGADNKIVIRDDVTVSGVHCQFGFVNGTFVVKDMGSSNGTYLNGKKITDYVTVTNGMKIQIGGSVYIISLY